MWSSGDSRDFSCLCSRHSQPALPEVSKDFQQPGTSCTSWSFSECLLQMCQPACFSSKTGEKMLLASEGTSMMALPVLPKSGGRVFFPKSTGDRAGVARDFPVCCVCLVWPRFAPGLPRGPYLLQGASLTFGVSTGRSPLENDLDLHSL